MSEGPQEQERWRVTITWGSRDARGAHSSDYHTLTALTWRPAGRSPLEVVAVCAEHEKDLASATELDVAQTGDRRVLHRP